MSKHPNSLKNLKKFEKGNPGGGRPKGVIPLVTILKRILEQKIDLTDPITKEKGKKEVQEAIMLALTGRALKGDMVAIKEILERIDGKIPQAMKLGGDENSPAINLETKYAINTIDSRIEQILTNIRKTNHD